MSTHDTVPDLEERLRAALTARAVRRLRSAERAVLTTETRR